MNALWVTRMSAYKNSGLALETARKIVQIKIERQAALLKKHKRPVADSRINLTSSLSEVFLEEARMAKKYWLQFSKLLPKNLNFINRKPRGLDIVNSLLDVGYHHLTNEVKKMLGKLDVSPSLALLHVARSSKSAPLAYDLVEMFRADIVDAEILRFLRLKKKTPQKAEDEIAHFLHEVNQRLERKHYLKEFKTCHTYRYYMEVQILKFIKAVNHKEVFIPLKLPSRHENRCLDSLNKV